MKNHWNYEVEGGYDGVVVAHDAQMAAEEAWEELCNCDPDFYDGGEVEVWKDGEPRQKFTVEVETVPSFHAYQKAEKPKTA